LIAVGSFGMAETPSLSSLQYSIKATFSNDQSAGQLFYLQNSDGESIVDFESAKYYSSFVYSSSELTSDIQYDIYTGGSCSGSEKDGHYEDGTYTPGSNKKSFSISSVITFLSIY
jgi:hypothetical protein